MKIKSVSVKYSRKLNLGDFNSVEVSCDIWAQMEPGDDESTSMHELWEMAKANVKAQLLGAKTGANTTTKNTFLGKPVFNIEIEDGNDSEERKE